MDQSERLHKEMRKLELDLLDVESRKAGLSKDPDLRTIALDLLVAEKIGGNDPLVTALRGKIEGKKKAILAEERALREKLNIVCRELAALTGPVIRKSVERLHREIADLKIDWKVIDRTSGGFSMIPKVVLETNEDAIGAAQKTVRDARETLNRMKHEPVSKIESFVEEELKRIRAVDLTPRRKEVEEFEHSRREFLSSPVQR